MKASNILRILSSIILLGMILGACAPQEVVKTVVVTEVIEVEGTPQVVEKVVVVTPTPEPTSGPGEKPSPFERADVVRMAILSDIDGTNPWYFYDITGSSYWNAVVLSGFYPTPYTVGDQRYDWVPYLAEGMPSEIVKEGDYYVGTFKLREGLKWSDGSALTAADVVFTANTTLLFALGGNWVTYFNPDVLEKVEAVDELTVKYYFKVSPGMPIWQYGTLIGPVVNKAFWEGKISDLVTQATALDRTAEGYLDQITPLQQALEAIDNTGEPTFGGVKFNKWEPGAYVEDVFNEHFPFLGYVEELFANGAYREHDPKSGYEFTAYGEPTGDKVLEMTYGPYFNSFLFPVYSQDAAYLALQNGEVDIVLNPSGVSQGLRDQLSTSENITLVRNAQNGFRYIEFNQAKDYFKGDVGKAVRQAIACQIDQEFLAYNVLQRQVEPVYTLVPPGLKFWHNDKVKVWCQGMTAEERLNEAVKILKDAGFTWDKEPSYITGSARDEGVVYGEGLKLPDGSYFPEITMQAPGPGYDPLRATSAVYLEQWMRQMAIPVTAVYTPFNTIRANENSGEFDIIMLGWGLTSFPTYLCDFFTGATGVADGSDNIAYVSPRLNKQCAEFYSIADQDEAQAKAFEIQDTLADELPYITLFTNPIYDAVNNTIMYPYTEVFDGLQGLYSAWLQVMPRPGQQ